MEMQKHTSSQIGHEQSTHPFTRKLAVGPPSDPLVEANENFAVHKQFRDQNSLSVPEPSLHPDQVDDSPMLLGNAPVLTHAKMSTLKDIDVQSHHHSHSYAYGGVHNSSNLVQQNFPFLVPKPVASVPVYSPKPMITFDVSKWTKEINGVTIEDESYDSIIFWYDLIQQAMFIASGKQDIFPDIKDLTKSFSFPTHLLPARTSQCIKQGACNTHRWLKLCVFILPDRTLLQNLALSSSLNVISTKMKEMVSHFYFTFWVIFFPI